MLRLFLLVALLVVNTTCVQFPFIFMDTKGTDTLNGGDIIRNEGVGLKMSASSGKVYLRYFGAREVHIYTPPISEYHFQWPDTSVRTFQLRIQTDGNLCTYDQTNQAGWCKSYVSHPYGRYVLVLVSGSTSDSLCIYPANVNHTPEQIKANLGNAIWCVNVGKLVESFRYVITSDPQLSFWDAQQNSNDPHSNYADPDQMYPPCEYLPYGKRAIYYQYKAIAAMHRRKALAGVVINGDLTDFGRDNELNDYKNEHLSILQQEGIQYYLGLGNHDYENNVNGNSCSDKSCPTRMIQFIAGHIVNSIPKKVNHDFTFSLSSSMAARYTGSFAYSWNEGPFHFIQLNNYATYTKSWDYNDSKYRITSSEAWLRQDLEIWKDYYIVVNMHQLGPSNDDPDMKRIFELFADYKIIALFTGHEHFKIGPHTFKGKAGIYSFPVFWSGASVHYDFLRADFDHSIGKVIVEQVTNNKCEGQYNVVLTHQCGCTLSQNIEPFCRNPRTGGDCKVGRDPAFIMSCGSKTLPSCTK